jgi:class 3 adenylate cyclase
MPDPEKPDPEKPDREKLEAAGLYDPASPKAADRLALLDWLADLGFTIDDMVDALERGQLNSLATDRALVPGRRLTIDEAAAASGLDRDVLVTILRASGFTPSEIEVSDASIELFQQFALARTIFSDEEALHFTRVMGSSLARIAEAANSLFLFDIESPMMATAPSEFELARSSLAAIEILNDVASAIGNLFRLHMQDAINRSRIARSQSCDSDLVPMAIGFVDLVGFTPLAHSKNARGLLSLVLEFESRAYDLVAEHGGRVVKLLGDEVMFSAIEPQAAVEIALQLFEGFRERAEVTPRGGIAYGELLAHGGDYYGSVVNLASRVADIAVPWEILVTDAVSQRLRGFAVEPAGRRMLKGFDEPVALCSVRRA